jgi:hypothetical protein
MGSKNQGVFDPEGVQEAEAIYRFILRRDPGNMDARLNLAWCLLLESLHQSGPEAENAGHLLQECLRHSRTVKNLCGFPSTQREVEKLEGLVLLVGGKELLLAPEAGGE